MTAAVGAMPDGAQLQLIALRGTILTFRSAVRLPAGRNLALRLPDGTTATLQVGEARTLSDHLHEYGADISDVDDAFVDAVIQMLADEAAAAPEPEDDQRAHDRQMCSFQVLSRDLAQFKALSADLSTVGIRIVTHEKLKKGRRLELQLAFDDDAFPALTCSAEVVWSRVHPSGFSAGLRFVDLTAAQREQLERYHAQVKGYRKRFRL